MRWIISGIVVLMVISFALQAVPPLRDPFDSGTTTLPDDLYVYRVIYRDPKTMATLIHELYPEVAVTTIEETKQLVIKTNQSRFEMLKTQLKTLDRPLEQISLEVNVIELNENELRDLGLLWDFSDQGYVLTNRKATDFIKRIGLMIGNGKAKIVANPKVSTMIGKPAVIHIGDQLPYTIPIESSSGKTTWSVKYLDAGVNLDICPVAFEPGWVSLKLSPEVSAIKQWKQTPTGEFPVISSRKVETELRVKDGESFVIGGLLNEEERENISKVPVLGDIPGINGLFRSTVNEKSKSDVVFLVTARKI